MTTTTITSRFTRYPNGRTTAEAYAAGDSYRVCFRKGDCEDGHHDGLSYCPGAGGIEESLLAARMNWPENAGRRVFIERVLPGSRIGCLYVEVAGEAVL